MEDKRDNLCVILAGYKDEMDDLINMNTGFESRIQFFIDFPDYTELELYEIFRQFVEKEKFVLDEGTKELLIEHFKNQVMNKDKKFSNGRLARNLFEKIKFEQATRVKRENNNNLDLITVDDIVKTLAKLEIKTVRKIGF